MLGKGGVDSPQRPNTATIEFLPEIHSLNPITRTQVGKPKNEGHPRNTPNASFQDVSVTKDKESREKSSGLQETKESSKSIQHVCLC